MCHVTVFTNELQITFHKLHFDALAITAIEQLMFIAQRQVVETLWAEGHSYIWSVINLSRDYLRICQISNYDSVCTGQKSVFYVTNIYSWC